MIYIQLTLRLNEPIYIVHPNTYQMNELVIYIDVVDSVPYEKLSIEHVSQFAYIHVSNNIPIKEWELESQDQLIDELGYIYTLLSNNDNVTIISEQKSRYMCILSAILVNNYHILEAMMSCEWINIGSYIRDKLSVNLYDCKCILYGLCSLLTNDINYIFQYLSGKGSGTMAQLYSMYVIWKNSSNELLINDNILDIACEMGCTNVVNYVLKMGALPSANTFQIACRSCNADIILTILDIQSPYVPNMYDALSLIPDYMLGQVNGKLCNSYGLLHVAVMNNDRDMFNRLVNNNVAPKSTLFTDCILANKYEFIHDVIALEPTYFYMACDIDTIIVSLALNCKVSLCMHDSDLHIKIMKTLLENY